MHATFETYAARMEHLVHPSLEVMDEPTFNSALKDDHTILDNQGLPVVVSSSIAPFMNTEFLKKYPLADGRECAEPGYFTGLPTDDDITDLCRGSLFDSVLVPCHTNGVETEELSRAASPEELTFRRLGGELLDITAGSKKRECAWVTHGSATYSHNLGYRAHSVQDVQDKYPEVRYFEGSLPKELQDQMLGLYEPAFTKLTNEHPIIGILDRDELFGMCSEEGGFVLARFGEDDKLTSFVALSPLRHVSWLNPAYYKQHPQFGLDDLYCPALVSDGVARKQGQSGLLSQALADICVQRDQRTYHFECPNRSWPYISRIAGSVGTEQRVNVAAYARTTYRIHPTQPMASSGKLIP
jgi:hypothetical protein